MNHSAFVKAALQSFFKRICPVITMKPSRVFLADVEATSMHIVSAAMFVNLVASGDLYANPQSCPFQLELCFSFEGSKVLMSVATLNYSDQSDDEDDDEDLE